MIKVLEEGFFTTIQDRGRFGYRHIGVPVSGAMDAYAAHLANSLLENETTAALLEITMTGPKLRFEVPTHIAITGASMPAFINDKEISRYTVVGVQKGDILTFDHPAEGLRVYIGVRDGVLTEQVLGSRSYYWPITKERSLRTGMEIPINTSAHFEPRITDMQMTETFHKPKIAVSPGPEMDLLSKNELDKLLRSTFHIAKENNRMAYQLEETVAGHKVDMLTSATLPGTVQLTPSGKLIILMRDAQTTGGYPRILQLSAQAISHLAQKKQGDMVKFKMSG